MSIKKNITQFKDQIRNWYYNERLSCQTIADKINCNSSSVHYLLKKWEWPTRTLSESHNLKFDQYFFDKIDTEEKAYFLGFIAADGNVHKNTFQICLHKQDEYILDSLKRALQADYNIKSDRAKYRRFTITGEYFSQSLKNKGISERKTFTLEFPGEDIVPLELQHHYMRGYFDGDGCIKYIIEKQYKKIHWSFEIVANQKFVQQYAGIIQAALNRSTKPAIRKEPRRENPIYYFSIGSSSNYLLEQIYQFLYKDATIFLFRKKDKFDSIINKINEQKLFRPIL